MKNQKIDRINDLGKNNERNYHFQSFQHNINNKTHIQNNDNEFKTLFEDDLVLVDNKAKTFIQNTKQPKDYYLETNPFTIFNPMELINTEEEEITQDSTKKNSSIASIFSIWSVMIGSGILSIPWASKEAGIIPTIFINVIFGFMMWYTAYIYVKTGLHAKDFSDTVELYFGRKFGYFGRILQIIGSALITIGANFVFFLIIK